MEAGKEEIDLVRAIGLTKEDCEKIAKKYLMKNLKISSERVQIIKFSVEKLNANVLGFLGEHLRLNLIFKFNNTEENQQFFIKAVPIFNPEQKKIAKEMRIIWKEGNIYSGILDHLPSEILGNKWVPDCYLVTDDFIVLEDLSISGYTCLPNRFNFNNDHIKCTLRSLAAMHACSAVFEKESLDVTIGKKFGHVLFETTTAADCDWFLTGLKALKSVALASTKYSNDPYIRKLIEGNLWSEMIKIFDIIEESPTKYPCVLTHRDLWSNNLMFQGTEDRPENCVLLDFQISRYLPQAYDVVTCLYLHLRGDERRKIFNENLKFYFDTFENVLHELSPGMKSSFITFEEFQNSCNDFTLIGIIMKGITTQITHLPRQFLRDLVQDANHYHQFELVDRSKEVLHHIDTDDYYKLWMVEAVEELIEFTLLNNNNNNNRNIIYDNYTR